MFEEVESNWDSESSNDPQSDESGWSNALGFTMDTDYYITETDNVSNDDSNLSDDDNTW